MVAFSLVASAPALPQPAPAPIDVDRTSSKPALDTGSAYASLSGVADNLLSLFIIEHKAALCRVAMSEEEETELGDAQNKARLRLGWSHQRTARLYWRARVAVLSEKEHLCAGEVAAEPTTAPEDRRLIRR
jgi:hypothetical protein